MIFYGDLETYCDLPLKSVGIYRYAEEAEILLFTYAVDDGPVRVVDFTAPQDTAFLDDRAQLAEDLDRADEVVFQNSMFDRTVLRLRWETLGLAQKYAPPPLEKWRDTMVQALAHSLPGGLEKLCSILQVPVEMAKLNTGKQLIQLFCKPRPKNSKIRRATRDTNPIEWAQFVEYAVHDVEAMRYIHRKLPTWNYSGFELDLWHLDQRINDRGLPLDLEMIDAALRTADREKARLARRTQELTGYDAEAGTGVASATQRDKLLEHLLLAHNVALPDMKTDTLERRLADEELPAAVRELIKVRLQASSASLAKYKAMRRAASSDGRVRGTLQFAGAMRTGRWSGKLIQPQNFMRTPKYLASQVELAAAIVKGDGADLLYPNAMEVLSAGVPWAIVAWNGRKFIAPDLSNIEGRVLAWLAGEQWKLDAFRAADADPDNKALDLYILGYAKSFKAQIADVVADYEAGGSARQIGKVQELALGYQGGVGAFVSMAAVYRVDLEDMASKAYDTLEASLADKARRGWAWAQENGRTFDLSERVFITCHAFTHAWRRANPMIVAFWADLEDAVRRVVNAPGQQVNVGRLVVDRLGAWLRIRLPSGRFLCYPSPRLEGEEQKISYMGVNQYTKRWQRIHSYGGKFAENVTQAVARDVLAWQMPPIEDAGYGIVMHVHDEPVAEVSDSDAHNLEEMMKLLTTNPRWADGLPLAAGGYESNRYRKD